MYLLENDYHDTMLSPDIACGTSPVMSTKNCYNYSITGTIEKGGPILATTIVYTVHNGHEYKNKTCKVVKITYL